MADFWDPKAIRRTWRGVTYDSQLEADWASTLTAWGMEFVYHPGRLFLTGGVVWEPDFLLGDETVLEVKGEHDDRIEKVHQAIEETRLRVIVGRSGFVPPVADLEAAGAVWEPTGYCLELDEDGTLRFLAGVQASEIRDDWMWSADVAWKTGARAARMFKAVGEDGVI